MKGRIKMKKLFTSESVTEGHPDKLCDYISDSILDSYLEKDENARVACETVAGKGEIYITGEISSTADIDIEKMRHIIETMTHFGFVITGDKGFDYGQVCQGGVALDDIDISNMECKKVKGVFFAGEVVDVDGKCGGYNLQWAWASGYVAGRSAASESK